MKPCQLASDTVPQTRQCPGQLHDQDRQCSLRVIREDGMVWYGVVWYGMVSDSTARTFQRRRKRA